MEEWKEGRLVWGHVRGFPRWPGQVMHPDKATDAAKARARPGRVLVAFGGDGSFNWLKPADLSDFDASYERNRGQEVAKGLRATFVVAVEEMKELSDRRKGLPPATNHCPVDFLAPPPAAAGPGLAEPLPPTPDAAALRCAPASSVLAWLRGAARSLEGEAPPCGGEEGEAASPLEVVAAAKAQVIGFRNRHAAPTGLEPPLADAAGAAAEQRQEQRPSGKAVGGRTPRSAGSKATVAGPGSSKKRSRGGEAAGEAPVAPSTERPKRARRPSVAAAAAKAEPEAEVATGRKGPSAKKGPSAQQRKGGSQPKERKLDLQWEPAGGWGAVAAALATLRALAASGAQQEQQGSRQAAKEEEAGIPAGLPAEAAVLLLRSHEARCAESSLRREGAAGPLLLAALAGAGAFQKARRRNKAAAPAAPEVEEPEEEEEESDDGEESDWAPPGHRAATGRAGRQPSSAAAAAAAGEGVGEEEEEEEEEEESESDLEPEGEGSSGKKAARGGAGRGGGPRRRGGRIKQGVAVEAPEVGSTFRQYEYADKVPGSAESFEDALRAFYTSRGQKLGAPPKLGKVPVDLSHVFKEVASKGGYEAVTARREWREVAEAWREGAGALNSQLREKYVQHLLAFELELRAGCEGTEQPTPAGARRGGKRRRSEGAEGEGEPGSSERPAKQPAAKPAKQDSPAAGRSTPLSWPPKGAGGSAGAGHKSGAPAAVAAGSGGRGKQAGAAAAAPGAKKEGGKAPTPAVPARPLIPRKVPASGAAAAGASSSAAARGGGDRLVLHFRFPKDYPIPTKASLLTKLAMLSKGTVTPAEATVYEGYKTAVVRFETEADAKKLYEAVREGPGRYFNIPADSVVVTWEAFKEKPSLPAVGNMSPAPAGAAQAVWAQQAGSAAQQAQQPLQQQAQQVQQQQQQQQQQQAQQQLFGAQQPQIVSMPLMMPGFVMGPLMAGGFGMAVSAQQLGTGAPTLVPPSDPRLAAAAASGAGGGARAQQQQQQQLGAGVPQSMQLFSNQGQSGMAQQAEQAAGISSMELMNILQAAGVNPAGAQAGGGTGSAAHTAPTMPALAGGGGLAGDGGFGAAPGGVGELGGGGAQQAQQGPDLTSQLLSFLGPYGK